MDALEKSPRKSEILVVGSSRLMTRVAELATELGHYVIQIDDKELPTLKPPLELPVYPLFETPKLNRKQRRKLKAGK